jgi:hypothetical protein
MALTTGRTQVVISPGPFERIRISMDIAGSTARSTTNRKFDDGNSGMAQNPIEMLH